MRRFRPVPFAPVLLALLAACATPQPARRTDALVTAAAQRGRKAFQAGRYEAATEFYRDALSRARMLNDRIGVGDSAYNLAACLAALGRHEAARAALEEALAEFGAEPTARAEALLLMARIARRQGRADEARAILEEVLTVDLKGPDAARLRALAHLQRAALACDEGLAEEARTALAAAGRAGDRRSADTLTRAEAATLEGRIAELEDRPREAAARFDQAAALYEGAGRPAEVAYFLSLAARSLAEAGEPAPAADRWYRAARSLFAQGRYSVALRKLDAGIASARAANCAGMERRLLRLLDEVERAVRGERDSLRKQHGGEESEP